MTGKRTSRTGVSKCGDHNISKNFLGVRVNDFSAWVIDRTLQLAKFSAPTRRFANNFIINRSATQARHRPHPFSTRGPYTSWSSLTDKSWSGRHLPPKNCEWNASPEEVAAIFHAEGPTDPCPKSTMLFPAFAQYLTDGFIQTVMEETQGDPDPDFAIRRRNQSNHQIDVCQLYGRTPAQTLQLRERSEAPDRRGRLKTVPGADGEYAPKLYEPHGDGWRKKEEFSALDEPLGILRYSKPEDERRPQVYAFGGDRANSGPQVSLINTIFLREHNRIAGLLCAANPVAGDPAEPFSTGRWGEPAQSRAWDDERVFQTTRNAVIAIFIKIVIEEYINHIMPLDFELEAHPDVAWKAPWNKPNWITVEFSLLYRWHGLIPLHVKWGGENLTVDAASFRNDLLERQGLAASFESLQAQRASKLVGRNLVSPLLQAVETAAIKQSRSCELTTYADYRDYLGLEPAADFEDVTSDEELARRLREIYGAPNKMEFYPGLFSEDLVQNSPLPELLLRFVALDAFTQALTNPLLSEHVFNELTFDDVGWVELQSTKRLGQLVKRNTPAALADDAPPALSVNFDEMANCMTHLNWVPVKPPNPILDPVREAFVLMKSGTKEGKSLTLAFVVSTIGEWLGLIFWLWLWMSAETWIDHAWAAAALLAGEAAEFLFLAGAIASHPKSHPRRTGTVRRGLILGGLTAFSESLLWLGWHWFEGQVGLWVASALLLIGMHAKHVGEMAVFTGKGFGTSFFDGRDVVSSIVEVGGAVAWFYLWVIVGNPVAGAAALLLALSLEHILQFKSAGFITPSPSPGLDPDSKTEAAKA